jgi:type II secretory ATPase GspE/PulE/Tfp pilus assembly ATPase PilB-like protein
MFRKPLFDTAGRKRRARELSALVRAWPHECENTSIGGRMRIIELLANEDRMQRTTQAQMPNFYNTAFHRRVMNALAREREALAAMTRALPSGHPMLQLRLIKD